ncbi:MAG: cytochrome c3 family protein [Desulfobulbaceae bacterium]
MLSCLLLGALSPALSFAAPEPSAAPAPTVTGPLATNYFDLEVNYTKPDDAAGVLVVARQAYTPIKAPIDTTVYTANARLGVGDTLVPGCILYCDYVVADAAASGTVTVTGLKAGTKYYFVVFSYNGTGTDINYNQTITPVSATTATVPPEGRSHNEQYVATGPGGTETESDCAKCHGVHHTSQLLPSGLDQLDKCQSCHRAGGLASAKTDIGLHPADGSVDCGTCHSMHSFRKEELFHQPCRGQRVQQVFCPDEHEQVYESGRLSSSHRRRHHNRPG